MSKPWEETLHKRIMFDGDTNLYVEHDGQLFGVALVKTDSGLGDLLAAAPELYRALDWLVDACSHLSNVESLAFAAAFDALKKARGE